MNQDRSVAVDPSSNLAHLNYKKLHHGLGYYCQTDRVPPESPHLLTECQVLTHILRAPVILPPTVLEMPHPSAPPTRGMGQL